MAETVPIPKDWTDPDTVEAWLRTQPRPFAVAFAARAALRVSPEIGPALVDKAPERRRDIVLPVFRATAAAWLAAAGPSHGAENQLRDIASAAYAAANRASSPAYAYANAAYAAHAAAYAAAAYPSFALAAYYAAAGEASADEATAYTHTADATACAAHVAADDDAACAAAAYAADAASAADPEALARRPLWPGETPAWAQREWSALRDHLLAADEGWEVWTDWYEARLRGDPVDVELETRRVIEPTRWDDGPAAVNAEITAIIADHAVSRTPVARELAIRRDTGRIDLLPAEARAAPDLSAPEALQGRLRRALPRLFERLRNEGRNDPYACLLPACADIEAALLTEPFEPEAIHDEIDNTREELRRRVADGDAPDDALTARLDAELGKASADIEDMYPSVARMVAARSQAKLRRLGDRELDLIDKAFDAFEAIVEPRLKEVLGADIDSVRDAKIVQSDDAPVPDGKLKDRIYRLHAYVLRIVQFTRTPAEKIKAILDKGVEAVKRVEQYQAA